MRRSAVRSRLAPPAFAASRLRLASHPSRTEGSAYAVSRSGEGCPAKPAGRGRAARSDGTPTRLRPAPPAVRAVLVRAPVGHGELPDAHRGGGLAALRADRGPVRSRSLWAGPVLPRDAAVPRRRPGHRPLRPPAAADRLPADRGGG